ncbi:MAG: CBS domain-containing protein, partial [Planctomycetes bacterium]|nr:CBS domain-containing protein [Planctomycetota bacterium]
AGFAYANSSTRGMPAIETVRLLETPFYVIFFVYAGASLHIDELPHIGAVGIAYVVARTVTKYMGTYIGAKRSGHPRKRCALLGASMLSHSAIVLALLEVIKERVGPTASLATSLQTLILGSVVVFEVFGPILVKISVLRSGEVSIVNAVPHKSRVVVGNQLFGVLKTFLGHLGFRITPKERTLASLVIQDTRALSAASDFDKLTRFIEHYPYDSFPVVDGKGVYLGFISFNEIKDASYDPVMKELVRAADLLTPSKPIDLDKDTIDTAYELIRNHTSTSLPVIRHDKEGKTLLVGVILQRDLTAAHVRAVTSPDQPNSADSNRLRAASDDEQA